jgi:hypothetical protein
MDPRGLRAGLTGAGCTSCGAAVPPERIAVLADRGDFAFVELDCTGCGSRTMGLVLAAGPDAGDAVLDTADHPEISPERAARLAAHPPVGEDDLLAMHRFLDGWTGDLRSLLDDRGAPDGGARR